MGQVRERPDGGPEHGAALLTSLLALAACRHLLRVVVDDVDEMLVEMFQRAVQGPQRPHQSTRPTPTPFDMVDVGAQYLGLESVAADVGHQAHGLAWDTRAVGRVAASSRTLRYLGRQLRLASRKTVSVAVTPIARRYETLGHVVNALRAPLEQRRNLTGFGKFSDFGKVSNHGTSHVDASWRSSSCSVIAASLPERWTPWSAPSRAIALESRS